VDAPRDSTTKDTKITKDAKFLSSAQRSADSGGCAAKERSWLGPLVSLVNLVVRQS
jgi:hypothetical protein